MVTRSSRLSSCQLSSCRRKPWEEEDSHRRLRADPHWPRSGPLPISEPIAVTLGGYAGSHAYHCCQGVWSAPFEPTREWMREALQRGMGGLGQQMPVIAVR